MITLHPHQLQLVEDIRAAYRAGKRAPLVVLPTGGGKTTIFSYITQGAAAKGNCIFLLAHRSELIKQISQTLARFGVNHAIVAPDVIVRQAKVDHFKEFSRSYVDHRAKVYVASVQTIVRRMDKIKDKPDIIVIDEAHHLTLKSTWGKVVAAYPDAKLLPVTATPCRLDGKGLNEFADSMVMGQTMRWLIDNGYLCEYRIFAPPNAIDLSAVKTRMGDYANEELAAQVDKPTITGDAVKHYLSLLNGKRAIVFCVSVKHAQHVADAFNASGVKAEMLEGSMESGERNDCIERFRAGTTKVMTSCAIVSEGFDLKAIEAAILLRPTQSLSLYLQQVGRALRVMDGKPCAYILDHVGNVARHGLPDDDREWSLDGAKKRRKNEVAPVSVMRCHLCYAMFKPSTHCPQCGAAMVAGAVRREIKQVEGTLVEITPEQRKAQQIARRIDIRKCRTYEELLAYGEQQGYQYPAQWSRKQLSIREQYKSKRATQ
jgi:superfamily II DNA or RNA helicase